MTKNPAGVTPGVAPPTGRLATSHPGAGRLASAAAPAVTAPASIKLAAVTERTRLLDPDPGVEHAVEFLGAEVVVAKSGNTTLVPKARCLATGSLVAFRPMVLAGAGDSIARLAGDNLRLIEELAQTAGRSIYGGDAGAELSVAELVAKLTGLRAWVRVGVAHDDRRGATVNTLVRTSAAVTAADLATADYAPCFAWLLEQPTTTAEPKT